MEKQLDEILPLYEKWGVKGVKYGFVNVGSQHWTSWLHEAVRKAAAHQLAISTIFFSPWQFLYWYDRPSMYNGDPALEYWKDLPTTWDDTRVISGEIGKHVCIARRKGREWYVGAIHANGRGQMEIPL